MIVEYIRYRIPHERYQEFEAAYQQAAESLATSPHCVDYELSRCSEEPDRYILRIRWDSLRGHVEGFRNSSQFREFFAHIRPYVQAIEEMQHYTVTDVVGTGAGDSGPSG